MICDIQFGFYSGFGIREALYVLNVFVVQRYVDLEVTMCTRFIDYKKGKKSFDEVKHGELVGVLRSSLYSIGKRDFNIIIESKWTIQSLSQSP